MENLTEKFCDACIAGNLSLVNELLRRDSTLVNCRGLVRSDHREFMRKHQSESGWSPLHLAGHYGQRDIVKALIESGADLDALAENAQGNTPLMAAVAGGNIEIVAELLSSGANPVKFDRSGKFNAVTLAEADGKPAIATLLRNSLDR